MADDLKASLAKVLHNNGKKRFFFAYGTGKRTDGNGDGHLVVAAKKPKKPDVQAACACSSFIEGYCWSSIDGGTLFFTSKTKLATPIVAKMALTAKKVVGKQYDFQVPSPEEETRGNSLQEGEEVPPAPPPGGQTNDGGIPPAPPGPTESVIPDAPPMPVATGPLLTRLQQAGPEVINAVKAKSPAAATLKELVGKAKAIIDKKQVAPDDYAQAENFLGEIDKLLKAPNGAPKEEQENVETEEQDENEAELFKKRLGEITPIYNRVKEKATGNDLVQLEAGWTKVNQLGDQEQYTQALKLLDALEGKLGKMAPPPTPEPSTTPIPDAPPLPVSTGPLATRLKALGAEVMKAVTAKSPAAATLKELVAKSKAIIDKKMVEPDAYGLVEDYLDDIELLLKSPTATPKSSGEQKTENEQAAEFDKRSREVKALLAEALKVAPNPAHEELQKLASAVDAAGQKQEFAAGLEACADLETACRKAIRSAEVAKESSGGEGPKRVLFAKSRDAYINARALAQSELARLVSAVVNDPDTQEDNRMTEIKVAAEKLPDELKVLDDRLLAALDTAFKASTANDRIAEAKKAREVVVGYQREIDGNQLLKAMDKDSGYGTFTIYGKLSASLQKLADTLNV
jgi:hypothetical protein